MVGIFVNDSKYPWTEWILSRRKVMETRNINTLGRYFGERVGIVRTGKGKAMLVGYATIYSVTEYYTPSAFYADEALHRVSPRNKEYAFRLGKKKVGYRLVNVERCEPKEIPADAVRHGRISVEL